MKNRLRTTLPNLALDRASGTPIYRQVYEQYRHAILTGQLRSGFQLPSSRELAAELRISRHTAMNAFDQLLAEGYVRGEQGSGTYVAAEFASEDEWNEETNRAYEAVPNDVLSKEARRIAGTLQMPSSSPIIPFRRGVPAVDKFPLTVWSRVVSRCCQHVESSDLSYSEPQGSLAFRKTLADYLRNFRAVKCEPEQVFVLSGSQQALQLIAHTLLDEDDAVWMEDPGYPGARSAFFAVGAKLLPVPIDDEGLRVSEGVQLHKSPKLIYVTPSHQFPVGVTMSLERRLSLLAFSKKAHAWILEDDYDSEFRFASRPISSLQGLSPDRVIYVGTFSKAVFPSLRLGFAVVPENLVNAFSNSRRSNDYCPPFLTQAAMNRFITEGHFARHLRRMRNLYAGRQSIMLSALRRELATLRVSNIETGLDLVLWLPAYISDVQVSRVAAEQGILTMPMSVFYSGTPRQGGLFLGFGAINETQIREGVQKLRRVIEPLLRRLPTRQAVGQ